MKKIVLIISFLILAVQLNAQEFYNYANLCFAKMDSVQLFTAWSRPRALDFDKDGDMDFALIDVNNDSLEVFLNNGSAKFTTIPSLNIYIGNFSKDLCVGDFNNDSYPDIATINNTGDLVVFKNLSGVGITIVNTYSNTTNPNLFTGLIEAGDLNNDGSIDIIGSGKDYSTQNLMTFTFQDFGSFNFGPIMPLTVFAGHTIINNIPVSPIAIADFNGDGYNDFVIGTNDMTDTLEVYQNLGSAAISFSSPVVYQEPFGSYVNSVEARDFNGDSQPDIAIAAQGGFSINKNVGSFNFAAVYSNASVWGTKFIMKDVNADTYPDLVTADWSGSFYVYKGTNTQGFPFGNFAPFFVGESYRFLLEEFDGNGIPDFVFVGTGDYPYLLNFRNFSFHVASTIVSTNTVICGSTPVNFLATNSHSLYPGNYDWTPGPATGFNYTATSASAVSCAFSYTLPPGYGKCILLTDTIIVNAPIIPTAILTASVSAVNCAGTPVTISANVTPASTTYTWSTGSSTPAIVVSPTTTTTYSLFMDNGCQSMATYTVNVTPNPTVNITATTTAICNGDSLVLNANGALNYTWYPSLATSTSLTVKPTSTSVYTLVGTNSFGCSDSTSTTITVVTPPIVSIIPSKSSVCLYDTITLKATGASTYTWNTGSSLAAIQVTALPFPLPSTYTVSGSNGCIRTASINLIIKPLPTVTAIPSKTTVCNGDSISITAFGAISYAWAPTFTVGSFFYEYPTANTTYTVLGQGSNGCYNYATIPIVLNNTPSFTITSSSNEICVGKTIEFNVLGAVSYTWNPGPTNMPIVETPQTTATLFYSVSGYGANGCKSSASQYFDVSDKCQLVIYNGITPNGDGHNDFFKIDNIEQYPGNVVTIFNRWGQQLDQITDYNNTNNFWSGTSGGSKNVPSGTYYYVIDLKDGNSLYKGYIELTR